MNNIVNKFLLARDKFILEMHLRQVDLHLVLVVLVDYLQKTKKEYKNLKKQEVHDTFIRTN